LLSAMKIGEGIVRFCPVTYLFNQYQEQQNENQQDQAEEFASNPS
jgi:hypothetical protein